MQAAGAPGVTTLGRYEVVKHLAQGGMAEVLLGRASGIEGFERYVVIKRIRQDQARDEGFVRMFLDEARIAASLHHNNVLQVHDIGESDGEYFFTMEYVHGQDLRKLLKRASALEEQIPLEQAVAITIGAATGLHHAHEHRGADRQPLGLVHRDVSLSNIMVGYDGFVKVTDFGIAKAVLKSADTKSGVLKGKVAYMSPEQCLGKAVDRRSDVYALGIVLYELATSRRLFKSESDFLTMSAIVDGRVPPPSHFRPEIPPELEAIILKALSKRADDRYQTADELRAALEDFAVAARLRTSIQSLASYMKALFGEQPKPWESDAPLEDPDDSDFDGSASGIVDPGTDALRELRNRGDDTPVSASSPFMKARTKAITGSPQIAAAEVAALRTAALKAAEEPKSSSSGRLWIALGGIAAAAAIAAVLIAKRGDSSSAAAKPAEPPPAAAAASEPPPPPPTPTPTPPAPPEPPPPEPAGSAANEAGSATVEAAAATPTAEGSAAMKTTKRPVKGKTPVRPKKGTKWDPDELLPH